MESRYRCVFLIPHSRPPLIMAFANLHVTLAHAYLNAVQAFDVAALSRILAPATRVQFLPSASLGPMGKPMDKAGLLSVMESSRSTMKDGRLPVSSNMNNSPL